MELMLCILLLSGVNKRVVLKDLKYVFLKLKYFKWVFFLMFILILKLNKIGWWLEESLILYNDGFEFLDKLIKLLCIFKLVVGMKYLYE